MACSALEQLAGEVGDDRDLGLAVVEALGDLGELARASARSGASGRRGRRRGAWSFVPAPPSRARISSTASSVAGDDGRGGAVDRGDRELCLPARDRLGEPPASVASIADHRPALGQGAHQARPWRRPAWPRRRGRGRRRGGRRRSRRSSGRRGGRASRPRLREGLVQGDLDREEGGLGVGGVLEQRRRLLALGEDDLLERRSGGGRAARRPRSKASAKSGSAS